MNQYVYREMLEEHVIPAIRDKMDKWMMQDGATAHTSNQNMEFLRSHFGGRLISNKADIKCPRTATRWTFSGANLRHGSGGGLLKQHAQGAGQEGLWVN